MEMVVAFKGADFAIVACDTVLSQPQSLLIIKNDLIKYHTMLESFLLVTVGSYADARVLVQFIRSEMNLYRKQFERDYTHHELVCKIRLIMNEHFGWEPLQALAIYYNEEEGAQIKLVQAREEISSHQYVGLGMLGKEVCSSCIQPVYEPNMTEEQAYLVMQSNMKVVMAKVPVNYPRIKVIVVKKNGTESQPDIEDF